MNNKKFVAAVAAGALALGCTIGGTVAWLTANTQTITNTFTYGDINVTLAETTGANYKVLPGNDLPKDPVVTVEADSEACWLFVKVEEANWPTFVEADGKTRKVEYALAKGWTKLDGVTGVYYQEVAAVSADTPFAVLADNEVTVSGTLTKAEIKDMPDFTLSFTAYAVQHDANIATAAEAWEVATTA